MATKRYKAITPGQRQKQTLVIPELTKGSAPKSLVKKLKRSAGRNNTGKITVRHRSGGNKKKYKVVDFYRKQDDIQGKIEAIHYDAYRTANVALVSYLNGSKKYILAPNGATVGAEICSGNKADIKPGNTLTLNKIPTGTLIHNVETKINGKGQIARSAGTYCTLMAKSGNYATIKLPSGEVRLIHLQCKATIGQVGNLEKRNTVLGKAGAKRKLGWRPTVRGSVMNPCDHPHGGGEGRAPIGRSGPCTPWGKPALGYKTRKTKNRYIVKKRK